MTETTISIISIKPVAPIHNISEVTLLLRLVVGFSEGVCANIDSTKFVLLSISNHQ
ncbi:hypothetical protein AmaxDRAFT_0145 [Limnospira maxima CS-328]|uniref:Uncharacterized protein n=1 Tax=Limnospira maxima CS-328 TaxID=513049 RepID=B5VUA4_LIMMA|nr:hypothetical protein AmaxDRAFT_0145 [Limnospira maxima CS-328]